MYLRISKNYIKDGSLSRQEIMEKIEKICREISKANEIEPQFPTSQRDYNKAQVG